MNVKEVKNMSIVNLTKENFDKEALQAKETVFDRFLGGMVRPLQDDLPYCGRNIAGEPA